MVRKTVILVLVVVLLFVIGYFLYDNFNFNNPDINIRGTVTNVTKTTNGIIMLVEGNIESDTDYDKASIKVDSSTKIVINSKKYSYDNISVGDKVEVQFKGPVAESYPVQVTAKYVNIIAKGSE